MGMHQVAIDFAGYKGYFKHVHYVALSRARTLHGLYIKELAWQMVKHDKRVSSEYERMRTTAVVDLCITPFRNQIKSNKLLIGAHNITSYNRHKENIFDDHLMNCADIVFLSETHLESHHVTDAHCACNAMAYHHQSGLRGTALYWRRSTVNVNINADLCVNSDVCEILTASVTALRGTHTCIVVGVYRAPKAGSVVNKFLDIMDTLLKQLEVAYGRVPVAIVGDLNVDMQGTGSEVQRLNDVMRWHGMTMSLREPTTVNGTTIDHAWHSVFCDAESGVLETFHGVHFPVWLALIHR